MPDAMLSRPDSPPDKVLTGGRVLAGLVSFFLVIFAANAVLVWAALSSWTGLETTSAWRAGQLYAEELRQAKAQAALGWRFTVAAERDADGASVTVEVRDGTGRPLSGLAFAAALERPTDQRQDRALAFAEQAPGRYVAFAEALAPGQWDLRLEARSAAGETSRLKDRLHLR